MIGVRKMIRDLAIMGIIFLFLISVSHIIKYKKLKFDNMILKNKLMKSEIISRCTEVSMIVKMQRLKS